MQSITTEDKENLRLLRNSKEYFSLDKLIQIRINNLREQIIESCISRVSNDAIKCADQQQILWELLEEINLYNKDEEE